MDGGEVFGWAMGITTLFVIVVVMNNYKGVANVITAMGNLYGSAVGSPPNRLPYPNA